MNTIDLRIAIVELVEAGKIPPKSTAKEIHTLLELAIVNSSSVSDRVVGIALRKLGFKKVRGQSQYNTKSKGLVIKPALWSPPRRFKVWVETERRCRRLGLSAGQTQRAVKRAHGIEKFLEDALTDLRIDGVSPEKRGVLGKKIDELFQTLVHEHNSTCIPKRELAKALGESPSANPQFLLSRVEGLLRFQRRKG